MVGCKQEETVGGEASRHSSELKISRERFSSSPFSTSGPLTSELPPRSFLTHVMVCQI